MAERATVGQIAAACGVKERTVHHWTRHPDWPAGARAGLGGALSYDVDALPTEIRRRGRVVTIRAAVQAAALRASFATLGAPTATALPAPTFPALAAPTLAAPTLPEFSLPPAAPAAGGLPAVAAPAAAGLSTLPMCIDPPAPPAVLVRGGLTRRAVAADTLDDKRRARRDGALVLCDAVDAVIGDTGKSARYACAFIAQGIIDGTAPAHVIDAASVTYTKTRSCGQTVAALTTRLQKMYAVYRAGALVGDPGLYLVPGMPEKTGHDPALIRVFLKHYCWPTRPTVKKAWEDSAAWFAAQHLPRPAVDTFYRIEKSLPVTLKYRGRVTGSEWRALKPFVDRDVSMFKANDLWVGDGHSFKAKVQHPIHGQPFVPEVTVILDWVSRRVVGWSVDLAESTVAVSAAFRNAQLQTRARPLVYYSDNGSGQTGKPIDCPIHGTLARQGIAHETGIPGNPQGRGIIERLWQVVTIPLAATYPTCTWKGADKETVRKMLVALNRKDGGPERWLPTFNQFIDDLGAAIARYNAEHLHRELDGLTPDQTYRARLDPDSQVFGPSDADIAAQWLPEVGRTPQRGIVSLFGNEYARPALVDELAEGERVRVRYDIHNAETVFLLRMDGRPIGEAKWNGHKVAAFPVPRIEQLREQRADGKIARGEKIIAEAQAELGRVIDVPEAPRAAILDFLPDRAAEAVPAAAPEKTLLDFLPDRATEEFGAEGRDLTHMETVALYMRRPAETEIDGEADAAPERGGRRQAGT